MVDRTATNKCIADAQKVYCNYYIDSTLFSVSAEALSTNPLLTETEDPNLFDLINVDNSGKGIAFQCYARSLTGNYFINGGPKLPTGLRINGVDCTFDNTAGPLELEITRRDNAIGGFVEGWFSFSYKDNANKLHTSRGDFRVRRN